MKAAVLAIPAFIFAACDPPKPQSPKPGPQGVADIPSPVNVPPPVDSVPFEDGYKAGDRAGTADAKADARPRKKRELPPDEQLAVIALEKAGSDPARGPKWQRGFVSGYRDGFSRVVEGKR